MNNRFKKKIRKEIGTLYNILSYIGIIIVIIEIVKPCSHESRVRGAFRVRNN